ncbi:MAG: hypothetical protein GX299_10750 [Epulopiscium sp.]|jgi:hypothetical protein|nr:hypothetical protein [Candidatus Epulonipiscium sp.]
MLYFTIHDTKMFMNKLLKNEDFDLFCLRSIDIITFASFQITGNRNKDYNTTEEQESQTEKFCMWSEIRPYAFQIIKGNRLPKSIKIIFSLNEKEKEKFADASALFLNIQFENNIVSCTTGCSTQTFTLDKSLEYSWDEWVISFFKKKEIGIEMIS